MAKQRKLQGEMEAALKKIAEGVDEWEDLWNKYERSHDMVSAEVTLCGGVESRGRTRVFSQCLDVHLTGRRAAGAVGRRDEARSEEAPGSTRDTWEGCADLRAAQPSI